MIPARMMPPFHDEERIVLDLLRGFFADSPHPVFVGNETPNANKFNESLPFVRAARVGGNSDYTEDHPVIDIDVLARTRDEAKGIAGVIQSVMMSCPHPIERCNVLMAPQKVEWQEGSPIRRFYASYHLTLGRPSA